MISTFAGTGHPKGATLARFCNCWAYNPVRAARILSELDGLP